MQKPSESVLPAELVAEFEELVSHYPEKRAALIPALHRCQEELGGWISPEVMTACAELFELEPVEVFGVASFYPMFHLRPVGTHVVGVCHNISCLLRGSEELLAKACELTGCAAPGATSPDGAFTVLRVECQGSCVNAPMIDLDGTFFENLSPDDLAPLLEDAKSGALAERVAAEREAEEERRRKRGAVAERTAKKKAAKRKAAKKKTTAKKTTKKTSAKKASKKKAAKKKAAKRATKKKGGRS